MKMRKNQLNWEKFNWIAPPAWTRWPSEGKVWQAEVEMGWFCVYFLCAACC